LRIRVPLLAGINDDERNIEASAAFAATLDGLQGIDILPYHHLAGGKYQKLAQTDRGDSRFRPTVERIELVSALFSRYGHQVHIGG
ncbi:MAG: glycyl-radical enzyme activating protein, partial [Desulfofustis sp.]|nr:glycyl-radical enzyme activating protein [Desulfofustis sp.]